MVKTWSAEKNRTIDNMWVEKKGKKQIKGEVLRTETERSPMMC